MVQCETSMVPSPGLVVLAVESCGYMHFQGAIITFTNREQRGSTCPESPSPNVVFEGCGQTRSTLCDRLKGGKLNVGCFELQM